VVRQILTRSAKKGSTVYIKKKVSDRGGGSSEKVQPQIRSLILGLGEGKDEKGSGGGNKPPRMQGDGAVPLKKKRASHEN